ncbi:ABC transporter ATP-binding protein [Listeria ilorinensis]|uniref:ABC transporter ATP-binding protein n=1 Tax=Listeria ilorinensis TaxID=2867439 RepID=UPI001EF3DB3E|nr:ABC transporter ATP-binding protein [Listeria ilorinensis]
MATAISLNQVSKSYKETIIFQNISFSVSSGEFILISGESGCGKSTLLNIMGGLERPSLGEISIMGRPINTLKERQTVRQEQVSFVFQNYGLVDNETVKQNFQLVCAPKNKDVFEKVLEEVNLNPTFLNRPIFELSGGEQQRIAIARTILTGNHIILADEPTGNLDKDNAIQILDLFKRLQKKGKTILCVSHDSIAESYADRQFQLRDQQIYAI